MGQLFEELKRRNVFRVAVAYIVASWLILQVSDIVLQGIEAPAWVMKVFMLIIALGFPFVLLFSWAYELTPEGIKKEKDVDRTSSITPETGRKLNLITIGMLVAVLAVLVIERTLVPSVVEQAPPVAEGATSYNSIAVLAFEDLSPDGDQEYFADGLSEELLNVLAKVRDLKVAGRTSSFAFKGTNRDLREIGELLNVAHILEGSVRKAGNRIRVTAQLIEADTGFHLFSETYDRDLEDIFAVQDEIAAKISEALLIEIIGTEALVTQKTDTEAYELYLMARQRTHTRDIVNLREANSMLDRALAIDPEFAPAHAEKAIVMHLMSDSLGAYGDVPFSETLPISQHHIERALAIDENLAEAHAAKGLVLDNLNRIDEAIVSLERARELNPTNSDAANWLSTSYSSVNRRADSRRVLEEIVKRDPTYGPAFGNLTGSYLRTSDFDKSDALLGRVEAIVGDNDDVKMVRGMSAVMKGDSAAAASYLQASLEINPNSTVNKMWLGFALLGLADYETLAEVGLAEHRIVAYAMQDYMERVFEGVERFDYSIAYGPRATADIGNALSITGNSDAYVKFIEERFGSVQGLLDAYPITQGWGTEYASIAAAAYREVGDEDAVMLLSNAAADFIDTWGDDIDRNWVYTIARARHAAVTGDTGQALALLEKSIRDGYRLLLEFDLPIYRALRDDERFAKIRSDLLQIVDAERAKAGLPPYRPLVRQQERPSYVN